MSTAETEAAGIDPQVLADLDAVMKRISDDAAVDSETSRRIEERADRITAEIRRTRGVMDDHRFQACFMTPIYLRQIHELVAPAVFIDEAAGALTTAERQKDIAVGQ